jgi:predicted component of type VI protein secretion system
MPVRIEKKMLRPGNSESMTARLVLQTGSRAGMPAPLQYGYYMIGRHQECQIRPKSRSVSRYHCLLCHNENVVQVLDLESTSGTRVNEEKLMPKSWVPLSNGDMLRCGKIVFRANVEIDIFADDFDEDSSASASDESAETLRGGDSRRIAGAANASTAREKASVDAEPRRQRPVRPPKQRRKRLCKAGPNRLRSLSEPDRLRMIGTIALTVLTVGCLGYSGYRYYNGPDVRVLEGID